MYVVNSSQILLNNFFPLDSRFLMSSLFLLFDSFLNSLAAFLLFYEILFVVEESQEEDIVFDGWLTELWNNLVCVVRRFYWLYVFIKRCNLKMKAATSWLFQKRIQKNRIPSKRFPKKIFPTRFSFKDETTQKTCWVNILR